MAINFDLNLIFVPLLVLLFLVWLADKLFFKQYAQAKSQKAKLHVLQNNVNDSKQRLINALNANGVKSDADYYVAGDSSPSELKDAYQDYQKHKMALASQVQQSTKVPVLTEWAYDLWSILAFILAVRAFGVELYNIPSSSMVPTLYTGDFIIANKAAYGLRLPIVHTKILDTGTPKRGDVVVFRYPKDPSRNYIKRMIGLPGDTVAFNNGVLSINGETVPTETISYPMAQDLVAHLYPNVLEGRRLSDDERLAFGQQEEQYAHYNFETLGEHRYKVRYLGDFNSSRFAPFLQQSSPLLTSSGGLSWQIVVPEGKYFVMGDNRDRSEDARFWGFVDEHHLAGKAMYIWMHKNEGLSLPSFGRVGKID